MNPYKFFRENDNYQILKFHVLNLETDVSYEILMKYANKTINPRFYGELTHKSRQDELEDNSESIQLWIKRQYQ